MTENYQNQAGEQTMPETNLPSPAVDQSPPKKLVWFDLIYGILFEPVKTYRQVAVHPPFKLTVMLIVGLNLLLALMDMFTAEHHLLTKELVGFAGVGVISFVQQVTPYVALLSFIFNLLLWLVYSSLLHMLAEFYGGQGRGVATFTVYGLAGLPALLLLPLLGLEIVFNGNNIISIISTLGSLIVVVWGIVLLTIGLREPHHITTSRALAVVVTPWAIGLLLFIILVAVLFGTISSLPLLEHFGKI